MLNEQRLFKSLTVQSSAKVVPATYVLPRNSCCESAVNHFSISSASREASATRASVPAWYWVWSVKDVGTLLGVSARCQGYILKEGAGDGGLCLGITIEMAPPYHLHLKGWHGQLIYAVIVGYWSCYYITNQSIKFLSVYPFEKKSLVSPGEFDIERCFRRCFPMGKSLGTIGIGYNFYPENNVKSTVF